MTDDFFRNRLDQMIDLLHPLAVLANRMPRQEIEPFLAQRSAREVKAGKTSGPNFVQPNTQDWVKRLNAVCCKLLICLTLQVILLTIYDMCKAVDRGMVITDVKLLEKHGGKSGSWVV